MHTGSAGLTLCILAVGYPQLLRHCNRVQHRIAQKFENFSDPKAGMLSRKLVYSWIIASQSLSLILLTLTSWVTTFLNLDMQWSTLEAISLGFKALRFLTKEYEAGHLVKSFCSSSIRKVLHCSLNSKTCFSLTPTVFYCLFSQETNVNLFVIDMDAFVSDINFDKLVSS